MVPNFPQEHADFLRQEAQAFGRRFDLFDLFARLHSQGLEMIQDRDPVNDFPLGRGLAQVPGAVPEPILQNRVTHAAPSSF